MTEPVIESIALRDVVAFAESNAVSRRRGDMVAISRSRARAWSHNPNAGPDDTVLLVARIGRECTGYLGLVPSRVRVRGIDERVDWLTSFYVSREWRDAGIGALLLLRACGLGHTLAAAGAYPDEARVYEKLGFVSPGVVEYDELDLSRLNLLGGPLRALRRLADEAGLRTRVLGFADGVAARMTRAWAFPLLRGALAASRRVHTKTLEGFHDRHYERVADVQRPTRFLRDAAVIDWTLRHPWTTTNGLEEQPRYLFDDFREDASSRLLEVHDDTGPRGFALLSFATRRGVRTLRLLDHVFDDAADALLLPAIVLEHAAAYAADHVFLPASCRPAIGNSALARRLFVARKRHTYVRPGASSRVLRSALTDLQLDYCDGDVSFA